MSTVYLTVLKYSFPEVLLFEINNTMLLGSWSLFTTAFATRENSTSASEPVTWAEEIATDSTAAKVWLASEGIVPFPSQGTSDG